MSSVVAVAVFSEKHKYNVRNISQLSFYFQQIVYSRKAAEKNKIFYNSIFFKFEIMYGFKIMYIRLSDVHKLSWIKLFTENWNCQMLKMIFCVTLGKTPNWKTSANFCRFALDITEVRCANTELTFHYVLRLWSLYRALMTVLTFKWLPRKCCSIFLLQASSSMSFLKFDWVIHNLMPCCSLWDITEGS